MKQVIPEDRHYSRNHVWIEMENEFIGICGITDFCQEQIADIFFVEFPEINMEVRMGEKVGVVESHKMLFNIKSPVSGRIEYINNDLESTPILINNDPFGAGWIYKIDVKEPSEFNELLNNDEYLDFIELHGDI